MWKTLPLEEPSQIPLYVVFIPTVQAAHTPCPLNCPVVGELKAKVQL
jgi:hypothetical protein